MISHGWLARCIDDASYQHYSTTNFVDFTVQKQISSQVITFSIWTNFHFLTHAHVYHNFNDNNGTNGRVHFSAGYLCDIDNNTSVPSTPEDLMLGKTCKLEPLPEEASLDCLKDSLHTLNPSSKISTGKQLGNPPPNSGRQSLLSGVIETARHRFDSFWANQKNGST